MTKMVQSVIMRERSDRRILRSFASLKIASGVSISNLFRISIFGSRISHQGGFTLLETIIAVGILSAAVLGPLALVAQSLFGFPFAKNKLIAMNLAQEGIELVRAIRDQNLQCVFNEAPGWQWDRNFNGSGTIQGNNKMIDATKDETVICPPGIATLTFKNPDMPTSGTCDSTKLKLDSSGRYGYVSGTDTIFFRCVNITNPGGADPNSIPSADMLDITSTVSWNEHGIPRSSVLKTRLYNWKKP